MITKTNELSRRQWATSANIVQEPELIINDEVALGYTGRYYYGEGDERSCTIMDGINSIDAFLDSAKPISEGGHGGFYIGRYEAGTEIERTSNNDDLTIPLVQRDKNAYVYVTRDQAKTQAETMYSDKTKIKATPQLISSYAWDTALNFICQNSEYGYELATTTSPDKANIGTNNKIQTGMYSEDCYSNIHDFLGNCREWTTEYSSYTDNGYAYPCVSRGGHYIDDSNHSAYRYYITIDPSSSFLSFRISLYV